MIIALGLILVAVTACAAVGQKGIGLSIGYTEIKGDDFDKTSAYDVDWGPNMGGHFNLGLTEKVSFLASFNHFVNDYGDEDVHLEFIYNPVTVGLSYDLFSFSTDFTTSLDAGFGYYIWEYTKNAKTCVEDNAFGINTGVGVEYALTPTIGIKPYLGYHYIFSKDQERYGPEDDNEYLADFGVAFMFYLD